MAMSAAGSAALIAGINAAGSASAAGIQSGKGKRSQRRAMAFNRSEAEKARQHQLGMAEGHYLRTVQSMKAAGLNPLMMYGGGGGAGSSAPSSSPQAGSAPMDSTNLGLDLGSVGSTAMGARKTYSELKQLKEVTRRAEAEASISKENAKTETIRQKLEREKLKMALKNVPQEYVLEKIGGGLTGSALQFGVKTGTMMKKDIQHGLNIIKTKAKNLFKSKKLTKKKTQKTKPRQSGQMKRRKF